MRGPTFRRAGTAPRRSLERYEAAYLAGGPRRVAETAVLTLSGLGAVHVRATRVRAAEGQPEPGHPVERALIALCPRSTRLSAVVTAVAGGPEVGEIGHRLAADGLITRFRRRPTRAGRRLLERARRDGGLPEYVFDGPGAVPEGSLRHNVLAASSPPALRRGLYGLRMVHSGNADGSATAPGHSSGDFSSGGGGGGGGD
ncbi:hypothetical protein GCM10010420_04050 [Streptomyces glaucosporus]|uniref:TIGR04222 domain-containing membrane protein n=1 Tax=Streptomyces glaucosporus TaxID=284044 RepID=A0ABP5UTL7_9ACTN